MCKTIFSLLRTSKFNNEDEQINNNLRSHMSGNDIASERYSLEARAR